MATMWELSEEWGRIFSRIDDAEGEITPDIEEELDALIGTTDEKLEAAGMVLKHLKRQEAVCREEAQRITSRALTFANQQDSLKERMGYLMDKAGKNKVKTALLTITRLEGRDRVEITNIDSLPPEYMVCHEPSPDKTEIARILKAGGMVAGAEMVKGPKSLSIR